MGLARTTDPATSKAAAAYDRRLLHIVVVACFIAAGADGLTDDELVDEVVRWYVDHSHQKPPPANSIKSARSQRTPTAKHPGLDGRPLRRTAESRPSNNDAPMGVYVHRNYNKEHTAP